MPIPDCVVCETKLNAAPSERGLDFTNYYDCPRCGQFGMGRLSRDFLSHEFARQPNMRPAFSHSLRMMQLTEECPILSREVAEKIMETTGV